MQFTEHAEISLFCVCVCVSNQVSMSFMSDELLFTIPSSAGFQCYCMLELMFKTRTILDVSVRSKAINSQECKMND